MSDECHQYNFILYGELVAHYPRPCVYDPVLHVVYPNTDWYRVSRMLNPYSDLDFVDQEWWT